MIVMPFQDLQLQGKQIIQSFSYCELITSPRNGTKVHDLYKKIRKCWRNLLSQKL